MPGKKNRKRSQLPSAQIARIGLGVWLWKNFRTAGAQQPESAEASFNQFPRGALNEYVAITLQPKIIAEKILDKKSPQKICYLKTSGISRGRTCDIDGVKYFMKYAGEAQNYRFQEAHNLLLLKRNLGINVPKFGYLQDSQLYFATMAVEGVTLAYKHRADTDFRANIVKYIGEEGVAKLAVAKTLIADLAKLENWGYTADGLVIIDADGGLDNAGKSIMPADAKGYFKMAAKSLRLISEKHHYPALALSLENINMMRQIYLDLLAQQLPNVDVTVNLDKASFHRVITGYVTACDLVIDKLLNAKVDPKQTADNNNVDLADAIRQSGKDLAASLPNQLPTSAKNSRGQTALSSKPSMLDSLNDIDAQLTFGAASSTAPFFNQPNFHNPSFITAGKFSPGLANSSEMLDLITPTALVAAGAGLTAAAFVYCMWRAFGKRLIRPSSPSVKTHQLDHKPTDHVAISISPKPRR